MPAPKPGFMKRMVMAVTPNKLPGKRAIEKAAKKVTAYNRLARQKARKAQFQENVVESRAVALDKRMVDVQKLQTAAERKAKLFSGRQQKAESNRLIADANTARGFYEQFKYGKYWTPTGKVVQAWHDWRANRNATKESYELERKALLDQARGLRETGVKAVANSKTIAAYGKVKVAEMNANRSRARMALLTPKAAAQMQTTVLRIEPNRRRVNLAYNTFYSALAPAARASFYSPRQVQGMFNQMSDKVKNLENRLRVETDPKKQDILVQRIRESQAIMDRVYELSKNPFRVDVSAGGINNAVKIAKELERLISF